MQSLSRCHHVIITLISSYPKTMSPSLRMLPREVMTVCCVSFTPKSFSRATTHSAKRIFLSTPLHREAFVSDNNKPNDDRNVCVFVSSKL